MNARDAMMTPEQVAEYLQLDRETIYRYIRSGKLAASKLGRTYRVYGADLDSFIAMNRVVPRFEPRIYTDEEIAEFLKADEIDDEARQILREFAARYR